MMSPFVNETLRSYIFFDHPIATYLNEHFHNLRYRIRLLKKCRRKKFGIFAIQLAVDRTNSMLKLLLSHMAMGFYDQIAILAYHWGQLPYYLFVTLRNIVTRLCYTYNFHSASFFQTVPIHLYCFCCVRCSGIIFKNLSKSNWRISVEDSSKIRLVIIRTFYNRCMKGKKGRGSKP